MIDRICISLNDVCNLKCLYCHFREKRPSVQSRTMDVLKILANAKTYIDKNRISPFKIGFVGNGEVLLDYPILKSCVLDIANYLDDGRIRAYTITNGTQITEEMISFLVGHKVNIGFSLDGPRRIHDPLRDGSYDRVMRGIELFYKVTGEFPTINATVGQEVLDASDEVIDFLKRFGSKITFSRMIGSRLISQEAYHAFLKKAQQSLEVRLGGLDCTMYGGRCGAGVNNFYFANGWVWLCGNCIDLAPVCAADIPFDEIPLSSVAFDRDHCFHEAIRGRPSR